MKTIAKGPFLGINNRLPDFALKVNTRQVQGDFLRDAVNVDITNSGNIVRRSATKRLVELAAPHSLHMVDAENGYMVVGGIMYSITLPDYTQTPFKVLSNNEHVSYQPYGNSIYYSNGTDSGRIEGGAWHPLALPTPSEPTTSVIGGDLFPGSYQIAVSHYNAATGEEGGVSASCNPEILTTGGMRVFLPAAVPGASHINVYISTVNGAVPMLKATVEAGTTIYDIISPATGREAIQRYEAPLPAGTQLFMFNGCLCSVKGSDVFEGIPYRPGYYLPVEGRIPFPAAVSNAIPAQNGIYVVADKTYWIPGTHITSSKDVIRDVFDYGGVEGTSFQYGDKDNITYGWFGRDGIVLATEAGTATAPMFTNIDLTPPPSGLSAVFYDRGYVRVVSCGWCLNLENQAATRYTGFDFTSVSGGYGTATDGVYVLSAPGKVGAFVDLGKENFGVENFKHLPAVYVGVDSLTPMELTVSVPEGTYTYDARSSSENNRMQRFDPGKGLRANWYNLKLANTEGSDFNLASVSFAPVASTRRI